MGQYRIQFRLDNPDRSRGEDAIEALQFPPGIITHSIVVTDPEYEGRLALAAMREAARNIAAHDTRVEKAASLASVPLTERER